MTVPNSLVVMVPSPSLSNKEKASLNSAQETESKYRRQLARVHVEVDVGEIWTVKRDIVPHQQFVLLLAGQP